MLTVYLAFYLAFYLTFDLTYIRTVHLGSISAAILNYSDILSGICSGQWGGGEEDQEEGVAPLLKSRGHHLAGGGKKNHGFSSTYHIISYHIYSIIFGGIWGPKKGGNFVWWINKSNPGHSPTSTVTASPRDKCSPSGLLQFSAGPQLTGAKRREWMGMGVAGMIITSDYMWLWIIPSFPAKHQ